MTGYATGTSNLAQWETILWAIESSQWPHARILDVGAGMGKASILLYEYLNVKPEQVDAIDADGEAGCHVLHRVTYQETWMLDMRGFVFWKDFDTVLMADVIEHIPHAEGMALLDRIPGQVIVSTPVIADVALHAEHADEIPVLERHVSQWSLEDFKATWRLDQHWVHSRQLIVRLKPDGA